MNNYLKNLQLKVFWETRFDEGSVTNVLFMIAGVVAIICLFCSLSRLLTMLCTMFIVSFVEMERQSNQPSRG